MWAWLRKQVANFRAWRRGDFDPPTAGDMFRLRGRTAEDATAEYQRQQAREWNALEAGVLVERERRAGLDRRALIRGIAAALLTSKLLDTPEFQGSVQAGAQEPLLWDDPRSDPLADVVAMRKRIEATTGMVPSTVVLTSLHRDYVLERFGVDLCDDGVRAELGRELGLKVRLVKV